MKLEGERVLARIFLDTFQKSGTRPIYEVLVERAREGHLAGATVLAGVEGLGPGGKVLTDAPWRLANDRTVVVEVVDSREKIEGFLAAAGDLLTRAQVTLERAHVVFYRAGGKG